MILLLIPAFSNSHFTHYAGNILDWTETQNVWDCQMKRVMLKPKPPRDYECQTDLGSEQRQWPSEGALRTNWPPWNTCENVPTPTVRHTAPTRRGRRSSPPPAPGGAALCQSHGCSVGWCRSPETARIGRPRPGGVWRWAATGRWSRWSGTWAQTHGWLLDTHTHRVCAHRSGLV